MGHGKTFKSAASKEMRAATIDFRFFRIPSESEALNSKPTSLLETEDAQEQAQGKDTG
jgi:hypothetical protein